MLAKVCPVPVVRAAAAFFLCAGVEIGAQQGAVSGTVRASDDGRVLGYGAVVAEAVGREQLTTDRGTFLLANLPARQLTLRFRRIGYLPWDTVVVVPANDTLRIDVALSPLSRTLEPMRVQVSRRRVKLSAECAHDTGTAGGWRLIDLLDQVVQNAEQYRLLVKSHPFSLRFTLAHLTRHTDGRVQRTPPTLPGIGATEQVVLVASATPVYRPGAVFRSVRGVDEVFVPELQDFASEAFVSKHCFRYDGDTLIDGTTFIRVSFEPTTELTTADVRGRFTLRGDGFTLAAVEMETTGIPAQFARSFSSIRVNTEFTELLPNIAVLSRLESFLVPGTRDRNEAPGVASRGELQTLLGVVWSKGPP